MIWLIAIMAAQSGALAYLIWTVRDLRKERTPVFQYTPLESTELGEARAHEALKNARIDQVMADFAPPAPKPWVPMETQTEPALPAKPSPTPRPDRSAEETGAWPYEGGEGSNAWFGEETQAMSATPPKHEA